MPLIFAYGSLQQEGVQWSTFGRRLDGDADALTGFTRARVKIEDPVVAAALDRTHHANVVETGNEEDHVPGMALEITDAEFAGVDAYERASSYRRIVARLASGRQAWVYVHVAD